MTPRLKELYLKEIQPSLKVTIWIKKFIYGTKNRKNCFEYGS